MCLRAQVQLSPGEEETVVYVPNTGSMLNLVPPQLVDPPCVLSVAPDGSKRKYQHTLEMIQVNRTFVGIHSALANKMVANALRMDLIPECQGFSSLRQEVTVADPDEEKEVVTTNTTKTTKSTSKAGTDSKSKKFKKPSNTKLVGSRIDFELLFGTRRSDEAHDEPASLSATKKRKFPDSCTKKSVTHAQTHQAEEQEGEVVDIANRMLVEVKSVTLAPYHKISRPAVDININSDSDRDMKRENNDHPQMQLIAEFPDSVSLRAKKHAECLTRHVQMGGRAALVFLIQRDDCSAFRISPIDPAYKEAVRVARQAGVLILPYVCRLKPEGKGVVELLGKVPFLEE